MQDNVRKIQQRNGFKIDYAPDWPMKAPNMPTSEISSP